MCLGDFVLLRHDRSIDYFTDAAYEFDVTTFLSCLNKPCGF